MTDDPKQLADEDGWKMTTEPVGEGLCLKPAHARLEAERDAALASLAVVDKLAETLRLALALSPLVPPQQRRSHEHRYRSDYEAFGG